MGGWQARIRQLEMRWEGGGARKGVGGSYFCFRSRSSLFRRGNVSENRVRNCLIPGLVKEWLAFKTLRVGREISSHVPAAAGAKTRARVDVEEREHLRRRVERRACPVKLALRHVTVSDIEDCEALRVDRFAW